MGLSDTAVHRLALLVSDNTFDQRFEILAEGGRGAMGCVFEARDCTTGTRVAIKLLTGSDRTRFLIEAEVLEQLEHPAIVKYVQHGVTSTGDLYLVMEWLTGETLSRRLVRGPLSSLEAVTLGERLAGALEAAHALQVVHRDVKPSNVLLVDGDVARATVIDFGVAKTHRDLTATGMLVGTPGYMAPEQVRGTSSVDGRVDLFALGCVLYEAIAGRRPFAAEGVMEVLARLLLETPRSLDELIADVPPRLASFVDLLLDKDPDRRGNAAAARVELAAIRAAIASGDAAALAAPAERKKLSRATGGALARARRRRRWLWAAGAGIGLATAAIVQLASRADAPAAAPTLHAPPVIAHPAPAAPPPLATPPPLVTPPPPAPVVVTPSTPPVEQPPAKAAKKKQRHRKQQPPPPASFDPNGIGGERAP